ncbi:hypothetical protein [Paraburkholderia kururiensis]|uniref:hypothetical protein n=1 Tax=Paraburkholderia kururiensis TaxID=984307 RepID=UPI0005A6C10C|nr:hypothetical protein [Paraburkholderia kururiensis]
MQLTNFPSPHLPNLNEVTGTTSAAGAASAKTGSRTGLRTGTGTQAAAEPAVDTTRKGHTGSMVGSNVDTTA